MNKLIFLLIFCVSNVLAGQFVEHTPVCISSEDFDELTEASIRNDVKQLEYLQSSLKCFVLGEGTTFSVIELNLFSASKIRVYVDDDSVVVYVSSDVAAGTKNDND